MRAAAATMDPMQVALHYMQILERVRTVEQLKSALRALCTTLGFRFFALSHHIDFSRRPGAGLRLHNYPEGYEHWFDSQGLGLADPVHRASQNTHWRFLWSWLDELIPMTRLDMRVLSHARAIGIGEGITVPFCVKGQMHGSLSFAKPVGETFDTGTLHAVQLVGDAVFACVQKLAPRSGRENIVLTDRQRECVRWAMRGKTAWETAQIMGISEGTVIDHLKDARARYGGPARSLLYFHVLNDGTLCLDDILMEEQRWGKSPQ